MEKPGELKTGKLKKGNYIDTPYGMEEVDRNNFQFDEESCPILMDEEWHNKFGVVKNGFHQFEYVIPRKLNFNIKIIFTQDYVMLRQCDGERPHEDNLISIWNKDLTKRDMYVHEFQNLYKVISGEELKIK